MKKRLLLLVNPEAGKGMSSVNFGPLLHMFHDGGYLTEVHFTDGPGDAMEIVRSYGERADLLVCMGGDGTLSDVMSGLVSLDAEKRPVLGYIPMGTANDVATTLDLKRDALEGAKTILHGKAVPFDVGCFGDEGHFSYIAAFGAFTEVSYRTNQEFKHALGHLAYLLGGIAQLSKIQHYNVHVEYDDGELDEDLIFGAVTNSTSVAGLVKLDGGLDELGDGVFEVLLVKNPKNVNDFGSIVTSVLTRKYDNRHVILLKSRKVKFSFETEVPWTRDGESGGEHREIVIENCGRSVQILVDKTVQEIETQN